MSDETMSQVIQIDEARIRDHLVRWFAGLLHEHATLSAASHANRSSRLNNDRGRDAHYCAPPHRSERARFGHDNVQNLSGLHDLRLI